MDEKITTPPARSGLIERAKAIVMQPKLEWPRIAAETTEPAKLLTTYVIPLAAIGPVAALIGSQLFGYNVIFATIRPSIGTAIATALTSFVMSLVGLFVVAFVANFLSPKFGGRDSFPAAFRLVAYSMTAAWIAAIFNLVPSLAIIGSLLGLYSIYLLYVGARPVMGVPQDKAAGYTAVTVIAAIVVMLVVAAVAGALAGAGMGGPTITL
ncbi:MAG TPA: Yip1 family protein [Croceibacterium sp.]|nr:Yip1 family protein [Croceibacterium sp.]